MKMHTLKIFKFTALCLSLPLLASLSACGGEEAASRLVVGPAKDLLAPNNSQYQQGFVVQVTDNEGNPAPATIVSVEMVPVRYFKGQYQGFDSSGDGDPDEWRVAYTASCEAEDANHNGVLETGEDINGNGTLQPTNPATLAQHPTDTPTFNLGTGQIITDDSGFGFFSVTYPVSQALWSRMRITVSANVQGTEDREQYEFTLFVAENDISNFPDAPPGGTSSPYGIAASCIDPL
jgi:hypothetical protein